MGTSGPRKAIVTRENLPPFTVFKDGNFGYRVRYRIASEDRNRFSHYSPIYEVFPSYVFERINGADAEDLIIVGRGPYVNALWEFVLVKDRETGTLIGKALDYDVWVKWDRGEVEPDPTGVWVFEDTVEGKQEGLTVPSNYTVISSLGVETVVNQAPNKISIEVYVRSTNPSRDNSKLLVYKKDNVTF